VAFQPDSDRQILQQRLNWFYVPIILLFVLLGARLWQLQILHGAEYAVEADRNRIRTVEIVAPRGQILDREGRLLVENRPSFNILLYREFAKDMDATTAFVTTKLGIEKASFDDRLKQSRRAGLYRPVVIKEDVGIDDISVVEAHRREHPEIKLGPEPRRLYRHGSLAAHVLGYVREVSEEELSAKTFPGARAGDLVGKSGMERIYNANLVGKDGSRRLLVDSLGRELGLMNEVEAILGGEMRLTLDLDLQLAAEKELQDRSGVMIAMNPRSGEILAMASAPSFDPNTLSARISMKAWNSLINDPEHPLQNRAIQSHYSPGSIFKLVMAAAGLEENVIDDRTRVVCTGSAVFYGRRFHCWKAEGHGHMNLENAIANSCNIFFYELGRKLGVDRIAKYARLLGLGEKTGVDLTGEGAGLVPSQQWKLRTRGERWYSGETISVAIGQGAVSVTPLQILRAVSAIALKGKLTTPHLFSRASGEVSTGWPAKQIPLDPEKVEKIHEGMWRSVNASGTGHRTYIAGLDICGKTGTVQLIGTARRRELEDLEGYEDHSWFAGFAPRSDPEIAVAVLVEHGGMGGASAAPLARELFRTYFSKKGESGLTARATRPAQEMPR
jgi:penicillin-binding protein 2